MNLDELETLATQSGVYINNVKQIFINAGVFMNLVEVAKAAKELCREVESCGVGAIDGEFGSNIEDSYNETMAAMKELEEE